MNQSLSERLQAVLPLAELPEFQVAIQNHSRRAIRLREDCLAIPLPFETDSVPWHTLGRFLVDSKIRPSTFLSYATCDYYIQDAGSLLPVALLAPKPGEWICDLCAAPGGKASAILECMNGEGVLVANEPIRSRTNSLRYLLSRTGQPNYLIAEQDPIDLARRCAGVFDAVLVDAPCSGQMMVARDKRDANAWSPKQVEHSAKRQNRILDAAIQLLRPGGRLVYSTCTFALEENEDQLLRLMEIHGSSVTSLQSESLVLWESSAMAGCYRLWPHRDHCAGGFAGGIVIGDEIITEDTPSDTNRSGHRKPRQNSARSKAKRIEWSAELQSIGVPGAIELRDVDSQLRMGTKSTWQCKDRFPEIFEAPLALIHDGKRVEPSLALALLRRSWFEPENRKSLSQNIAEAFVSGESVREEADHPNGVWSVIEWNDRPIGWARRAQGVWKNHLPSWARLR
jgi:16S rRNA C967 or C1407 C5-methylase (RsmB/RsmF family)